MIFVEWCDNQCTDLGSKQLWRLTELPGGRTAIADRFPDLIRSHYDNLERISEDIRDLGYPSAAALLAERLPRSKRARSGELGEILATELVEEKMDFIVPVRRLRYKDGREMALRGDDFIGIRIDESGNLDLLKGEAKSRATLAEPVIVEARRALCRNSGRPTATSLLFIADRLMENESEESALGRMIRNEVVAHAVPPARIDHALFTMSGNAMPQALIKDFQSVDGAHTHTVIHLRIEDRQDFIRISYEGALTLGDN